jgi:hypothetical protein
VRIRAGYELIYRRPHPTPTVRSGDEHACATKTAWQAFSERTGVCRDVAHLADTAISTSYGASTLESFRVWTDEVGAGPARA